MGLESSQVGSDGLDHTSPIPQAPFRNSLCSRQNREMYQLPRWIPGLRGSHHNPGTQSLFLNWHQLQEGCPHTVPKWPTAAPGWHPKPNRKGLFSNVFITQVLGGPLTGQAEPITEIEGWLATLGPSLTMWMESGGGFSRGRGDTMEGTDGCQAGRQGPLPAPQHGLMCTGVSEARAWHRAGLGDSG